jgi:hypothetical protein
MVKMMAAKERDVNSLRNWLNSTGCIARAERRYLDDDADLMNLTSENVDGALSGVQELVEDCTKWLSTRTDVWDKIVSYNRFTCTMKCEELITACQGFRSRVSRDEKIFIVSEVWLAAIGRVLMAWLLGMAIIAPVVIVDSIHHLVARSFATFLGTTFFIGLLAFVTKARTVELFLAGAT